VQTGLLKLEHKVGAESRGLLDPGLRKFGIVADMDKLFTYLLFYSLRVIRLKLRALHVQIPSSCVVT